MASGWYNSSNPNKWQDGKCIIFYNYSFKDQNTKFKYAIYVLPIKRVYDNNDEKSHSRSQLTKQQNEFLKQIWKEKIQQNIIALFNSIKIYLENRNVYLN